MTKIRCGCCFYELKSWDEYHPIEYCQMWKRGIDPRSREETKRRKPVVDSKKKVNHEE